jgi:hypothetical protein
LHWKEAAISQVRARRASSVLLAGSLASLSCVKFASELDSVAPASAAASEGSSGLLAEGDGVASAGQDWSCAVGEVEQAGDDPAALTYVFELEHFITGQPMVGASLRACFRADVSCESPLSEAVLDGSEERARVTAFEGFNGYLEITADGMLPTMVFFKPWSAALLAQLESVPIRMFPQAALLALGSTVNVPVDPAAGLVSVAAFDCAGAPAGGVRLELDRSAIPYVFVDDLPVIDRDSTGAQGLAGFVNVPPGIVVVAGYRADASEPVGLESMLVRPGWVSNSFLLPAFSR